MIRVGEFGNTDNKKSVQISMPDDTFTSNIQSIEIVDNVLDSLNWEKSVRVLTAELYNKPLEYSSQETFSLYDYSQEGTDKNTVEKFKTAGYPRLFDVEHTAFTSSDLLNLDVSAITKHDLVWVAKKDNHEWDVLRLTAAGLKITAMRQINNATQLEVILTANHNFVAGDYFTILNSQYTQLNGVYKVYSTPSATSLIFDYKILIGIFVFNSF
jgi:hypothetical protein